MAKNKIASQSPFPSTTLSEEERQLLLGMFKPRGFTVSEPGHYVKRVLSEEKGRAETKVNVSELVRAFEENGFALLSRTEDTIIMGKRNSKGLIGLKIHSGRDGKTRIMWKTRRLSQ
ncbi:MAG: hypothetical protein QXS32_07655 [Candidatus Nezhaarchaeales archaeon]